MRALLIGSVILLALAISACGGSLTARCEGIEWQSRQCKALKGVKWAKAHGVSPTVIEGYYSLPESER